MPVSWKSCNEMLRGSSTWLRNCSSSDVSIPRASCSISNHADITELARNAIRSALPVARAQNLTLELEEQGPAQAFVDPKRITQVFDNLLANAIKFTEPGGRVTVCISCEESGIVASVS